MTPAIVQPRGTAVPRPSSGDGQPLVSIVLPARNEVSTIVRAILAVDDVLADLGLPYEIVVGDSASTDGTGERALSMVLEHVRVVRCDLPGKGRVLTAALTSARGGVVGFLDSDLEIDPGHLRPAIYAVLRGCDAAIASKAGAAGRARPFLRRSLTAVANELIRVLLGTRISDHQAGMKVFRRSALLPALRHVRTTGWLWDTELLATMCARGASVHEIAVTPQAGRPSSFAAIGQVLRAGLELADVCLRVRGELRYHHAARVAGAGVLSPVK